MQKATFIRDNTTDALINIDDADYRRFVAERQKIKQDMRIDAQIKEIFSELADIRRQLSEIRNGK